MKSVRPPFASVTAFLVTAERREQVTAGAIDTHPTGAQLRGELAQLGPVRPQA